MFTRRAFAGSSRARKVLLTTVAAGGVITSAAFVLSTSDSFKSVHLQAEKNYWSSLSSSELTKLPVPDPVVKPPSRYEQLDRLRTEEFDVLIIGGGATGAGCALDAAARGLKVALVERDDFASGTSSRSTKLVHGGVRYLEKAVWNLDIEQYNLVKEALNERATFIDIAPHLSFALPIMIPVYKWWQVPYFWAGTKAYDLLAGKQNLEPSYFMSRSETLKAFPTLRSDNLKGALVYYDGSHNDSRMNTAIALTAVEKGATVLNHVEVINLKKDANGNLIGAVARDVENGNHSQEINISAKSIINATGPFADGVRKLDSPVTADIVAPSSGVHVVLPDYYCPKNIGLIDPSTSDGRVVFFLPWQGQTLAGTTDSPCTIEKDPIPTEQEIDWILTELQKYANDDLVIRREDVLATWSGIRPLVRDPRAKNTESLVRNHLITVSDSGLITVAGGKWTTYRQMAEDTIDEAVNRFKLPAKESASTTKQIKLVGAENYRKLLHVHLIQTFAVETDVAQHLADNYGDRAYDVIRLCADTGKRFPQKGTKIAGDYPFVDGEIRYAVQYEYARTAADVISRRLRLAFLNAKAALETLPAVIDIMGEELKWDAKRKQHEWDVTVKYLYSMGLPNKPYTRKQVEAGQL
ncbi:FAD dependent oxidoreductase-domain-containing protein [Lipomyces japonicus]|uniref:FAD dependent oxidoreductase-domain-containing protein n=1 Tax=Lipomyces japonicus TaxID=56871 RepID=UPI0034CE7FE8